MAMSMKFSRAAAARPVRAQAVKPQAMKIAQAAGLSLASFAVALSASAANPTVKLGADSGALVFEPASIEIASGETVDFVNNAGFPHNVVFDEDAVPAGVNADAISRDTYLNAPGETYSVKLTTAGTYGYYCEPHQGAGMVGKIIVK